MPGGDAAARDSPPKSPDDDTDEGQEERQADQAKLGQHLEEDVVCLLITLQHERDAADAEAFHVADQVAGTDPDNRALRPDDQGAVPEADAIQIVATEPLGHDGPERFLDGDGRQPQTGKPGDESA